MLCIQGEPAADQPLARFRASLWLKFCLVALLLLTGCQSGKSPGDDHDDDDHHAAHVIPAHKPKTFPDAVRRLRELTARLDDRATLSIATDIAGWLPEIAADSDMPEAQWNFVSAQSALLVDSLSKFSTNAPNNDPAPERARWNVAISNLEKQLAEADPKWFQQKFVNNDSK